MNKDFSHRLLGAAAIPFLKLHHPLVHISIWLKIRVNEKRVHNQTGSADRSILSTDGCKFTPEVCKDLQMVENQEKERREEKRREEKKRKEKKRKEKKRKEKKRGEERRVKVRET